jgi:tetratricopeptide (TPR) repeat protein
MGSRADRSALSVARAARRYCRLAQTGLEFLECQGKIASDRPKLEESMESGLFLIGLLIVVIAVYRLVSRKVTGPQPTVRGLLRQHHSLEQAGLSEQECLISRRGWKNLPPVFLAEIVTRLRTKENVFRFLSLAEGYRFHRKQLPGIVARNDMETAIRELAVWLGQFGNRLQKEFRLKEAEFVQKLALALQPDHYFTKLPLAATYYKMERYAEAVPLLEQGLAELEKASDGVGWKAQAPPALDSLEPGASLRVEGGI